MAAFELGVNVQCLVEQLHNAWAEKAPLSTYAQIRDALLVNHEQMETCIVTLSTVARIAHKEAVDGERLSDPSWQDLFHLAASCGNEEGEEYEFSHQKRKRVNRDAVRVRNLALIASFWSLELVKFYNWDVVALDQLRLLRACAIHFPRFKHDFIPRINSVLLQRHKDALRNCRERTLNEAQIQPYKDLDITKLTCARPDDAMFNLWTTNNDGLLALDTNGTLLKAMRPLHFRMYLLEQDHYGMLVPRQPHLPTGLRTATQPADETMYDCNDGEHLDCCLSRSESEITDESEAIARAEVQTIDPRILLSTSSGAVDDTSVGALVNVALSPFPLTLEDTPGDFHSLVERELIEPMDKPWYTPSTSNASLDVERWSMEQMPRQTSPLELRPSLNVEGYDQSNMSRRLSITAEVDRRLDIGSLSYSRYEEIDLVHTGATSNHGRTRKTGGPIVENSTHELSLKDISTRSHCETCLRLSSPEVAHKGPLRLEEHLHNKYRLLIAEFCNEFAEQSTDRMSRIDLEQFISSWLNADTLWARIWTVRSEDLAGGQTPHLDEADVLCYQSEDFVDALRNEQVFHQPVIVKEQFTDTGLHTVPGLISMLRDSSSNNLFNCKPSLGCTAKAMPLDKLHNAHPLLYVRALTMAHRPLFTMLPRFRLLESLAKRSWNESGKRDDLSLGGIANFTAFNVFGKSGAYVGPEIHGLGGYWVRNLQGVKLWLIMLEQDMATEWDDLARKGSLWKPNGQQRLILLEKDDVLFLPPGMRAVSAMISMEHGLMEGGSFWDDYSLVATLQTAHWYHNFRLIPVGREILRIIAELKQLVTDESRRFSRGKSPVDFKQEFEMALSRVQSLVDHI